MKLETLYLLTFCYATTKKCTKFGKQCIIGQSYKCGGGLSCVPATFGEQHHGICVGKECTTSQDCPATHDCLKNTRPLYKSERICLPRVGLGSQCTINRSDATDVTPTCKKNLQCTFSHGANPIGVCVKTDCQGDGQCAQNEQCILGKCYPHLSVGDYCIIGKSLDESRAYCGQGLECKPRIPGKNNGYCAPEQCKTRNASSDNCLGSIEFYDCGDAETPESICFKY
jgi:hypothetical protein